MWEECIGRGGKHGGIFTLAVDWMSKSAKQDYAEAQFYLGWMYFSKKETMTPEGFKKALDLINKAAGQGYAPAQALIKKLENFKEGKICCPDRKICQERKCYFSVPFGRNVLKRKEKEKKSKIGFFLDKQICGTELSSCVVSIGKNVFRRKRSGAGSG